MLHARVERLRGVGLRGAVLGCGRGGDGAAAWGVSGGVSGLWRGAEERLWGAALRSGAWVAGAAGAGGKWWRGAGCLALLPGLVHLTRTMVSRAVDNRIRTALR